MRELLTRYCSSVRSEFHSDGAAGPADAPIGRLPVAILRLAAVLPAATVGVAVFFTMPSPLGHDIWRGYTRLSTEGVASVMVWALFGVSVLAVAAWVLIAITDLDSVGGVIRTGLWVAGISALSLTAAWVSMDVSLHNVVPQAGVAPGSTVVVTVALLGIVALVSAAIAQIVTYSRGANHSPPSGGSVSSTEAGRPMKGSATAVSEP